MLTKSLTYKGTWGPRLGPWGTELNWKGQAQANWARKKGSGGSLRATDDKWQCLPSTLEQEAAALEEQKMRGKKQSLGLVCRK